MTPTTARFSERENTFTVLCNSCGQSGHAGLFADAIVINQLQLPCEALSTTPEWLQRQVDSWSVAVFSKLGAAPVEDITARRQLTQRFLHLWGSVANV